VQTPQNTTVGSHTTHGKKAIPMFCASCDNKRTRCDLMSGRISPTACTWENQEVKEMSLYSFFWVIPRRLNFMCRRFGTLCLFHLHRW